MELNIETFNPTVAELTKIKQEAIALTETSPLHSIVEMRKKLVKTRGDIQRFGKSLRDEANAFNKKVLEKEHDLLDIIEPEEARLKKIEADIEEKAIREARRKALPIRQDALKTIGDGIEISDDVLLGMNDEQFIEYRNTRVANKEEAERIKIERENELEQAKETARKEAEEKAKREAQEAIDKANREKDEAERKLKEEKERAEREAKEAEEKAKAEEKRLAKETDYKKWLSDNSFDKDTMKLIDHGTAVQMYKLVATYQK